MTWITSANPGSPGKIAVKTECVWTWITSLDIHPPLTRLSSNIPQSLFYMTVFGKHSSKVENKNCATCQWEVLKPVDHRVDNKL